MKNPRNGLANKMSEHFRVGERFLLSFDDTALEAPPYQGRLQDISKDGLLCIDAPSDVLPPRGTPITVCSLRNDMEDFTFSTQIYGRGRLNGRIPVILLRTPQSIEKTHRRGAYRASVCLRAQISWLDEQRTDDSAAIKRIGKPCVLTNLSGGGAQFFLRDRPDANSLRLSLTTPTGFIEEIAKRRTPNSRRGLTIHMAPFLKSCEKIRSRLNDIEANIAHCKLHLHDARGSIYAVSVAFKDPQEICYQLVRYLERQSIRKGLKDNGNYRGPLPQKVVAIENLPLQPTVSAPAA